jgi:hypothetical protein
LSIQIQSTASFGQQQAGRQQMAQGLARLPSRPITEPTGVE